MFLDCTILAQGHVEVRKTKKQKSNHPPARVPQDPPSPCPTPIFFHKLFWISTSSLQLFAGAVVPVILDVTLEDTVASAARFIQERGDPLVGLVNCAGLSRRLPLELEPMEAVKELYEVGPRGV